ncbi:MAG: hypothetical protein Q4C83_02385 [Candidatus Saccharibacteria bacterium]|nr:hypothetical protein [Candidatus Saccharibacteria bacterium]
MASRQYVSTRASMRTAYAGGGSWGRNQNLVEYKSGAKLGPIANIVTIILLVALLGMVYVTQVSKTGSYGYELNDINERKTELAAEQDDLKVENARLQALSNIKNSSVANAMTTPASTDYAE